MFIRLTELQIKLYKFYMENKARNSEEGQSKRTSILFADFQNLQRIWTHPRVLRYNSDRYEVNQQKKVGSSGGVRLLNVNTMLNFT